MSAAGVLRDGAAGRGDPGAVVGVPGERRRDGLAGRALVALLPWAHRRNAAVGGAPARFGGDGAAVAAGLLGARPTLAGGPAGGVGARSAGELQRRASVAAGGERPGAMNRARPTTTREYAELPDAATARVRPVAQQRQAGD